jgi:hypothetical protein
MGEMGFDGDADESKDVTPLLTAGLDQHPASPVGNTACWW